MIHTEADYLYGISDRLLELVLDRLIGCEDCREELVRMLRPAPEVADAVATYVRSGREYEHFTNPELRARWDWVSRRLV